MTELVKLIRSYLENVDIVLAIFKSKVGNAKEGKSWKTNIPDDGEFLDSGISKFHRHGTGIWVYYKDRFIDFNFSDLNFLDLDDSNKFITIEVSFLASFIKSLGTNNERWTDYSYLKEDLNKLVDEGLIKKIEYHYYLKEDLDELARTRPSLQHKL